MKTLYLDLSMGAAGDMLAAALLELTPDPEAALRALNGLGIPGVVFTAVPERKCGILGTRMRVSVNGVEEPADGGPHARGHEHEHEHEHGHEHEHEHEHEHGHGHTHTHPSDVRRVIKALRLPQKAKADALAVYGLLAAAESEAHGQPAEEIHFHEVGTLDAIADVTAVCWLLHLLAPEKICASPVTVGGGTVRCAHGVLPVPAPATALLLRGVPTRGGEIQSELCTPTGAALLKHFVSSFGPQPLLTAERLGYGMGTKDFAQANCVRALLGETAGGADESVALECNVDDMTAEQIAFAMERLFDAGAREVFAAPVTMKKSRPGTLLKILCAEADRPAVVRAVFRYTTTIGLRQTRLERYVMNRETVTVQTPFGPVRRKVCDGWGAHREKYEYEDLARIAREQDLTLAGAAALADASANEE